MFSKRCVQYSIVSWIRLLKHVVVDFDECLVYEIWPAGHGPGARTELCVKVCRWLRFGIGNFWLDRMFGVVTSESDPMKWFLYFNYMRRLRLKLWSLKWKVLVKLLFRTNMFEWVFVYLFLPNINSRYFLWLLN